MKCLVPWRNRRLRLQHPAKSILREAPCAYSSLQNRAHETLLSLQQASTPPDSESLPGSPSASTASTRTPPAMEAGGYACTSQNQQAWVWLPATPPAARKRVRFQDDHKRSWGLTRLNDRLHGWGRGLTVAADELPGGRHGSADETRNGSLSPTRRSGSTSPTRPSPLRRHSTSSPRTGLDWRSTSPEITSSLGFAHEATRTSKNPEMTTSDSNSSDYD